MGMTEDLANVIMEAASRHGYAITMNQARDHANVVWDMIDAEDNGSLA